MAQERVMRTETVLGGAHGRIQRGREAGPEPCRPDSHSAQIKGAAAYFLLTAHVVPDPESTPEAILEQVYPEFRRPRRSLHTP